MKCFVCIYFSILSVTGAASTVLEFKKGCNCEVTFEGSAEVGGITNTDIDGKGGKLSGSLTEDKGKVSGKLVVPIASFDMGMRQKHFNADMDVEHFPDAILVVKDLPSTDGDHALLGQLTLHGVTKKITGTYSLKTDGAKRKLEAKFDVELPDFKIPQRNIKILKVEKTFHVEVKAVAE